MIMKTLFRKLLFVFVCVFSIQTLSADNDRPIQVNQLPQEAQTLIQQHFANLKVALAKQESGIIEKTYDVIFTDGTKIEFDRNGRWTEISCQPNAVVPAALVPTQVTEYINKNYSQTQVRKIERERKRCEVELTNKVELTFDQQYRIIDVDL
jgi:hypothetical protein